MSKLLEHAITEVRKLPEKRQEEAAEVLLGLVAQNPDSIQLSAQQVEDLRRRLNDPSDLRADDTEVAATFQRLGV